jgi:hypothetical protein
MNTGQMMLSILAVTLLGTTILTTNRTSLQQGTILRQAQVGIYCVSLATSYIQKAMSMDFDEGTVTRPASLLTSLNPGTATFTSTSDFATNTKFLTLAASLGPDTAASHNIYGPKEWANKDSSYDDFDDYNGFSVDTSIANVDRFHVSASVYYVTQPTVLVPTPTKTTTPTWLKRMDLYVNSSIDRKVFQNKQGDTKTYTDTIKFSYIKSFY